MEYIYSKWTMNMSTLLTKVLHFKITSSETAKRKEKRESISGKGENLS